MRSKKNTVFENDITCRVVGLAQDAKFFDLREAPPRTIYLPLSVQRIDTLGNLVFLMNTPKKSQAIDAFRTAAQEIMPTIPLVLFVTLREQMDAALGSQELITLLANFIRYWRCCSARWDCTACCRRDWRSARVRLACASRSGRRADPCCA